jgi:hypothetical protein
MTTLANARTQWVQNNPPPLTRAVSSPLYPVGITVELTQAEYDARADDAARLVLEQEARKLVGQTEIEALGFTVEQVRAVYGQLKAGAATNVQAQKALAAVLRYLWRELLGD